MIEIIIFILLIGLTVALAVVKSMPVTSSTASEYELNKQANSGDQLAALELQRRQQQPQFEAVKRLLELLLIVAAAGLAFASLSIWIAAFCVLTVLVVTEALTAKHWLWRPSLLLQKKLEPLVWKYLAQHRNILRVFGGKNQTHPLSFSSKDELRQLIKSDQSVLESGEKSHLLGAFDFGGTKVAGHLIERRHILTVDQDETVGPLLLDRLHKAHHNIFVVVKKSLDHVQGLLYMSDLVPLDPDVKTVKDVTRPTVHYLPETATLKDVLAASLKTGRQFFLVVNAAGRVIGLITLRDVLRHLLGEEVTTDAAVATDPAKL